MGRPRASRTTIGQQEVALLTFPLRRPALPAAFSAAEREVALALLEGKTNSEIAAARDTSVRTVANQVGAMFRKLGVHSRPEFVVKIGTEPVQGGRRKRDSGL